MFSWKQAAECAKLSTYAYQSQEGFNKVIRHPDTTFFDYGGTQAYALNSKEEYILVFRGSGNSM